MIETNIMFYINLVYLEQKQFKLFFSYAIYLCFGIPPYFIGAYHRLIFRLAQNDLLSPDEASSGLLKLDFRFEMR